MYRLKVFGLMALATLALAKDLDKTQNTLDHMPPPLMGKMHPLNTQNVGRKYLDIAYATQSQAQKLDIYLPKASKAPYPVILAIHGGGFAFGDKASGEVNPQMHALKLGYAVVSVNYRLSKEATFPMAIYDLKAAVRFIKAHATQYHLNPNKIIAWGDSAGGNLASMLGTTAFHSELEDLSMGNAKQTSQVNAVVDFYGPIDFKVMDTQFKQSGQQPRRKHSVNTPDSAESRYMGIAIPKIPYLVEFANPASYISKNTPPFFIMNGSKDPIVPTEQSVLFTKALQKVLGKDKVVYIQLPGVGHGGRAFEEPKNLAPIFAFLKKWHLAPLH
ncbi:alpha/beta hydrolase [Helicobacter sp. NHP21005]|uniref:alpha/beta hydrolase n=1 Tax=Helicobacter felistomachi TaxID=3040201 RepID=UPI00257308D7|nr:alpha/beta hydrolase [Helicobacter sp. NHP21005]BEG57556.1 alpha/beta hydrolase [Helicobacter sp. NHP21005]